MTLILQEVQYSRLSSFGITLMMARADLIHPLASGNKIYKLLPNLEFAKKNNYNELLSFGGAFSNHIHALALMSEKHGFKSIGIIRGEEAYRENPTLSDAQKAGMQLQFVSRQEYKRRNDESYLQALQQRYPNALIVPEGGSSQFAIAGCVQLARDINKAQKHKNNEESDIITVACGTGATLAGLACGATKKQKLIGYAVLRDESLFERVKNFINTEKGNGIGNNIGTTVEYLHEKAGKDDNNVTIEAADFGGYAKIDITLLDFVLDWLEQTNILLDPVYTSKMCMKLMQQIEAGSFKQGTTITMVHSGGLQGWRGMKARVINLVGEEKWRLIEKYI